MDDSRKVFIMRIFIIVFIVLSALIALIQYKSSVTFIAQLMSISWGALAGAFLAPFLYGLYWKGVTRAGVWAGFVSGVGVTISNMFLKYIESPINAGAAAMVVGLIVVPLVSWIKRILLKRWVYLKKIKKEQKNTYMLWDYLSSF